MSSIDITIEIFQNSLKSAGLRVKCASWKRWIKICSKNLFVHCMTAALSDDQICDDWSLCSLWRSSKRSSVRKSVTLVQSLVLMDWLFGEVSAKIGWLSGYARITDCNCAVFDNLLSDWCDGKPSREAANSHTWLPIPWNIKRQHT